MSTAVSNRKATIQNGCAICSGTKSHDGARMISPRMIDFVAAAPT